jgi:hypothetical protein
MKSRGKVSLAFFDLAVAGGTLIALSAVLWLIHGSERPDPKWAMLERLIQAAEPEPEVKG